jgi:hypothetical protein
LYSSEPCLTVLQHPWRLASLDPRHAATARTRRSAARSRTYVQQRRENRECAAAPREQASRRWGSPPGRAGEQPGPGEQPRSRLAWGSKSSRRSVAGQSAALVARGDGQQAKRIKFVDGISTGQIKANGSSSGAVMRPPRSSLPNPLPGASQSSGGSSSRPRYDLGRELS